MLTGNSQFEIELKKLIAAEIERLRGDLESGLAVNDHSKYREYVGELRALRKVAESYCDEANTIINKER